MLTPISIELDSLKSESPKSTLHVPVAGNRPSWLVLMRLKVAVPGTASVSNTFSVCGELPISILPQV